MCEGKNDFKAKRLKNGHYTSSVRFLSLCLTDLFINDLIDFDFIKEKIVRILDPIRIGSKCTTCIVVVDYYYKMKS